MIERALTWFNERRLGVTWTLAGLSASIALALTTTIDTLPPDAAFLIPWPILILAFAVTEYFVVHLRIGRYAHSLSFIEIALVIGLAFAAPVTLIVTRVLGSALTLAVLRRQEPVKLGFNLANALFETVVAIAVFQAIYSPSGVERLWLALGGATVAAQAVGATMVTFVLIVHDPTRERRSLRTTLVQSTAFSTIGTVLGIFGVVGLSQSPIFLVVFVPALGLMVASLTRYDMLEARHDDLVAMHGLVSNIADLPDDGTGDVIEPLAHLMRSDLAELGSTEPDTPTIRFEGGTITSQPPAQGFGGLGPRLAATAARRIEDDRKLTSIFSSRGFETGLFIPLDATTFLAIGQRVGPETGFTDEDLRLFETATEYVAATLRRRALLRRLQGEVAERNRIIASKDELIASVGHELRTPLTIILGFTDVLRDGEGIEEGEYQTMIGEVADHADDLGTVVDDLLAVARAGSGTLSVRSVAVDLTREIDRVLGAPSIRRLGPISRVGGRLFAMGDPARVRQVLRHLISNALRHGGPDARIEVEAADDAIIRLVDNGVGIPDDERDRMFERFERLDTATSQPGSLGLGLSVSAHLAEMMGGSLSYRRENDETVFELRLPLAAELRASRSQPDRTAT